MREIFDRLYSDMGPSLKGRIRRMVKEKAKTDELYQETFLKAWEKRDSFRGNRNNPAEMKGWIKRIAVNLCLDEIRRLGRRPLNESRFAGNEEDEEAWESFLERRADNPFPRPEEELLQKEMLAALSDALGDLEESKKRIIDLVYLEELSLKEASLRLGIPYGTAKSRLHYSIKRLSALLEVNFPKEEE